MCGYLIWKLRIQYDPRNNRQKGIDSDYSLVGEVELGDDTSIESPVADDEYVEVYSLSGVSVYKGIKGCMPELTKGVYVLRSKNVTEKIYCR